MAPYGGATSGTTASRTAIGTATSSTCVDEPARGCWRARAGAVIGSGVREAGTNRGWPEPGARRSLSSEESGGAREQHDRRREIEDRQLDLREPRDPGLPDEPDDEGADERALEAPESADDNADAREDKRVHTHAEHRRLARHDDGAAQPRHEA